MAYLIRIFATLFCCLLLSYLLGKVTLQKLLPQASALLYIPFGFIIYEVLFFCISIGFIYLHGAWSTVVIVASSIIGAILLLSLFLFNFKEEWQKIKKISKLKVGLLFILLLLGIGHGFIQIGFWNVDNAMSDNSFYVTVATSVMNNAHIFATNAADGMAQSLAYVDYLMATYEISVAYLAQVFGFHPAAFMRLVMPMWMSIATVLTIFTIFRQLLKKDILALIGVSVFFIFIYCSPNYKNSLNDYMLEEWFLYYYYIGKGITRYLVIPLLLSILISMREAFIADVPLKKLFKQSIALNIIGLAGMVTSPAASLYYLAILFVYFLMLLFDKRCAIKKIVLTGFSTTITGILGLSFSLITRVMKGEVVSSDITPAKDLLQFFGIHSENFNLAILQSFFINGNPSEEYWYPRWAHILIVFFAFIFLVAYSCYRLSQYRKTKKAQGAAVPQSFTNRFFYQYNAAFFFGILVPIFYMVFYHLPPFVEILTLGINKFGFQRLVGSYPYELLMITLIIMMFLYFNQIITEKLSHIGNYRYPFQVICSVLAMYLLFSGFIIFPERPFTYEYAMSQERRERLKFKDDYYDGTFNYQRLLANPYKLDYQAEQIVSILSQKTGEKIVVGTINQFFGLSHVRNYDNTIDVVKTRFSTYQDETLSDNAYLLKVYFSPWENKFSEYQKDNDTAKVKQAMQSFGVNYIVLIKNYKTAKNFGKDMIEQYKDIIVNVDETEQFYIVEIDN